MPVKIFRKSKAVEPAVPRGEPSATHVLEVPKRLEVDTETGEVVLTDSPPDFAKFKEKDPAKVIAEYDRLVKHFKTMPEKYPQAKEWDKSLWERCLTPIKRDRAAYLDFARKEGLKLPKGVK